MRRVVRGALSFCLSLIAGVGSQGCAPRGYCPLASRGPSSMPSTTCPYGMRGVRIAVNDERDAVDITLTSFADVERVRAHAREVVASYMTNRPPPSDMILHDDLRPLARAARLAVEDTLGGATIRVIPVDRNDLGEVRHEVHARVKRASESRDCR